MLTPIEIHNKELKTGRGYSKKEMDEFLDEILESYESLYKENIELKEKLTKLSEGIQYYKTMESTLQKALVLAEKTSKDTIDTANSKAKLIEKEATIKAEQIINKAYSKCDHVRQQCISLIQQYNQFKMQFKQIAIKQIDLLDSDFYEIYSNDLNKMLDETMDCIPSMHKDDNADLDVSSEIKKNVIKEDDNNKIAHKTNTNKTVASSIKTDAIKTVTSTPKADAINTVTSTPKDNTMGTVTSTSKTNNMDTVTSTQKNDNINNFKFNTKY